MPETPTQNSTPKNSSDKKSVQNSAPAPEQKEKFSSAMWIILGTAAVIIDIVQGANFFVTLGTIGTIINMLADIFIGLSLATLFLINGMLDWKLGVSLILGFLVDFLSAGVMPAWSADIGYAWLVTDGANKLGSVPVIGEQARQAALMAIQKGKGGAGGATGAAGAAEKAAPGAVPPVLAKGSAGSRSVDGIKPGTGGGAQRNVASSSEKPPVFSEQNQNPPLQKPQTSNERGGGDSEGPRGTFGERKDETKKPNEENKSFEDNKKESGGESDSENSEGGDENKKAGGGDDKSKEDKRGKENADKSQQKESENQHTGKTNSHSQNHSQSSGNQTATDSSRGSGGTGTQGGKRPQNTPRYGFADEHPFIAGVDTALGVKEKDN